MLVTSLIII